MRPKVRVRLNGDHQDEEDLDEVGQAARVLERVRRVGVVEPAAVRAELLDRLLAGHGSAGDGLRPARQSRDRRVAGEVLHDAAEDQHDAEDDGDRQQDADRDARQVDPEVAEPVGVGAGQAADEGDGDRDADGGGQEVLHGEAGHLGGVAEGRLTGVRLPVRVGDEADGRVEGLQRRHPLASQRVRQVRLQPQQREQDHDRRRRRRPAPTGGRPTTAGRRPRRRRSPGRGLARRASAAATRACAPCSRPAAGRPGRARAAGPGPGGLRRWSGSRRILRTSRRERATRRGRRGPPPPRPRQLRRGCSLSLQPDRYR